MKCAVEKTGKFKYRLVISMGNDGSGHYPRKIKRVDGIRNNSQLEEAKAKFLYEVSNGLIDDRENMLFCDLVNDWWKKHASRLSPRTQEGYESNLRLRILPSFGKLKIGKIRKYHVQDFFDKLAQPECEFNSIIPDMGISKPSGDYFSSPDEYTTKKVKYTLSPATIKNHLVCVNSIFTYAVRREYIRESPAKGIETPSTERKRPAIYGKQDLADLFHALQDEPLVWKAIVLFAVATGAREGEIAGFERKYLNLDKGTALIAQAAISKKREGVVIKSTKTGRERDNVLPAFLINTLKQLDAQRKKERLLCGDTWVREWNGKPCDFFFTSDSGFGRPLRPDSISQWWNRFLKRKNLKHIKFHALRHTSVALSIDKGDSMKAISERVGHRKIGTTMDIYGQLLEEAGEKSARLLDSAFDEISRIE